MKAVKVILALMLCAICSTTLLAQLSPSPTRSPQKTATAEPVGATAKTSPSETSFEKTVSDCNIKLISIEGNKATKVITLKFVLVNKTENANFEIFHPEMFDVDGLQNKNNTYYGGSRRFEPLYANIKSQAVLTINEVQGNPSGMQILNIMVRRDNVQDQAVQFHDVPINWK